MDPKSTPPSAVESLPTEVLERILLRARPELPESPHVLCSSPATWPDVSPRALLPVTVCRVLRRWNQIALNLPSLWTFLYLDFAEPLLDQQTWNMRLQRSKGDALTIVCFLEGLIAHNDQLERCCQWYSRVF